MRKLTRPSVEFLPVQMECLSCTVSCKDSSRLSGLQIVLSFWSPAGLSRLLLDSHGESASVSGFLQGSTSVYFSPRPVPLPAPQSCCRQLPGGERGKDSVFLFLPRCIFLPWGSLLWKVKTEFCHCHGEKCQPMEGAGPCQGQCLPLGGQDRMLSSLALPPTQGSLLLPQRSHYRHLDCAWQMEGGTVTTAWWEI